MPAHDLSEKIRDRRRIQHGTKDKSEERSIKMGVVVDSIVGFPSLEIGEDKVQRSENESRHTQGEVKANILEGHDNNERENNGGDTAGSAKRIISRVLLIFDIRGNIGNDDSHHIQQYVIHPAHQTKNPKEQSFDHPSEKIKGDHVKQQMHMIAVYEAGRQEPVILLFVFNLVRVHYKISQQLFIAKGGEADQNGNGDKRVGDKHGDKDLCNLTFAFGSQFNA